MPAHKMKDMSVSTSGKPTEKTGVPQPPMTRHSVMDGIVKGVPRGMRTPMPDGIITGTKGRESGGGLKVAASATKLPTQEFGAVPYQMSAFGR
jgi:hypothetical protein